MEAVWWWFMAAIGGGYTAAVVWVNVWWRPRQIQRHLSKQGINGPPYHLLLGNIKEIVSLTVKATSSSLPLLSPAPHNILPRVLPFFHHWNKIYGKTFLLWFGSSPRLIISDLNLIREILVVKEDLFEKVDPPSQMRKLEDHGLTTLNGHKWSLHRKILSPLFHVQNIKLMVPTINEITKQMLDKWCEMSSSTSGHLEIDVSQWFLTLTGDIIIHAVFGTSYQQGKAIFNLQTQQVLDAIGSYNKVSIPGFRFVPTKKNRDSWRLERQMRRSLIKLIEERIKNSDHRRDKCFAGDDVLDLMIKARIKDQAFPNYNSSESAIAVEDIVGECKNMFFAGKHTTSNLLTWTMVLLAMHPTWQEMARDEVLSVCGGARDDLPITKDDVAKLKTLGMIVNESLRLYQPAVAILRRAKADVELESYLIPRGTELLIPTLAVHHDPTLWGSDSTEFNPARFSKGVTCATKHPMAFMPFGIGPRRCIGQNLATLQAKLSLAMILKRFSFVISPSYRHAPTILIFLQPQHGAQIIIRKLHDSY